MPNGSTHDSITLTLATLGAGLIFYDTQEWRVAFVYAATTLISGLILSPDLDLHSESYIRWGSLKFIWWPYKTALPHRHWASHGLIIGLIIRVIYLHVMIGLLLIGGFCFADLWMGESVNAIEEGRRVVEGWIALYRSIPPLYLLAGISGLLTGSESHILADYIGSALKGKKKQEG